MIKITRTRLVAGSLLAACAVAGAVGGSVAYAAGTGSVVTIDAAAQPDAAAKAMALFPDATDKAFAATDNPVYDYANWENASPSALNNPPKGPGNEDGLDSHKTLRAEHAATAGWSVGGSVEATTKLNALGFAKAKLSIKFTAEHEWETETTNSVSVTATAKPGKTVWIKATHSEAKFHGDYTFTAAGTTYHVNNVLITMPAAPPAAGAANDPATGVIYMAVEAPYAGPAKTASATGIVAPAGLVPIADMPQLTAITARSPKLAMPR